MSAPVLGVLAGGHAPFGDALASALDVPLARLAPGAVGDPGQLAGRVGEQGLVWIHLVPSCHAAHVSDPHAEAALLLRSAETALAASAGVPLTFVAVLPTPGAFAGPSALACDLAATALTSLMRTRIGTWSGDGRRIVGVVHAGLAGVEQPGQRPSEEIRLRTPMQRLGTVAELADAIRFVGSRRASYVTGTVLRVDGGCDAYSWVYPARTI